MRDPQTYRELPNDGARTRLATISMPSSAAPERNTATPSATAPGASGRRLMPARLTRSGSARRELAAGLRAGCESLGERLDARAQLVRAADRERAAETGEHSGHPLQRVDAHAQKRLVAGLRKLGERGREAARRLVDGEVEQHLDLPRPGYAGE